MGGRACLEEKVLEYWFTLEFLGQDKYPHKELLDAHNGARRLKTKLLNGQKGYKSAFNFAQLGSNENLYDVIRQEAEQCHMKKWGNITVYIGKVKRESCIECIAKALPFKNDMDVRPEKSFDEIACVSLQLTPEGKYIRHSLSLSTIVWAIKQIKNSTTKFSDCLNEREYKLAIADLENRFFPEENVQRASVQNDKLGKISDMINNEHTKMKGSTLMQEFDMDAVSPTTFEDIYHYIRKQYLTDKFELRDRNEETPYSLDIGVSFQMFIDEETRNKEEDDNYLGLSHDYFSDDLKMVLDKIKIGRENVPDHVLDYITSIYNAINHPDKKARIDLIHPKDKGKFEEQVQEILSVENAPIGKWPSKYMPAFMQQMAINLSIKKGMTPLFKKNKDVFSVNGPPGTGKTTLLKEVIANNIIERALLLTKYDKPDDAFVTHSFQHGSKQNKAYSKYTQHWYSLKDDSINDYNILVASCNNAAVENISKELPLGSKLLNDLKPNKDDSDALKAGLNEISEMFDFTKSCDIEVYDKNSFEYPDIYFTYLAQKLLGEKSAWGLIAASLGKKKNIRDFYQHVLYPLKWNFYPNKDAIANRLPKYKEAKEKFLDQVQVVCTMQKQMKEICDYVRHKKQLETAVNKSEVELQNFIYKSSLRKNEINSQTEKIKEKIAEMNDKRNDVLYKRKMLLDTVTELESKQNEYKKKITEFNQDIIKVINNVGRKPLLFRKKAYNEKFQHARSIISYYEKQIEDQQKKLDLITTEVNERKERLKSVNRKLKEADKNLNDLNGIIVSYNKEISELHKCLSNKQKELNTTKESLNKISQKYNISLDIIDDGELLDTAFISNLLSADDGLSTDAHVKNPWFTTNYNREREKLFYYAIKMNKEFILASKKCRDNFTSLAHYWGLLPGDDKEKIVFHQEDRRACAYGLYQTLFLLVPVISTTFASVGTFLRDVRNDKVIGTLIVDEAGQAQPHMAVGALYRSKRALIVGDPKQVEPVVTDDLKLLKNAFDDEELKPYTTNKNLSVQSCADEMNVFGTYLDNPEHPDFPDWIGCPLIVHRRCISPMYEISNAISYNGIMKKKTVYPKADLEEKFIYSKSQWIQVKGREKGNRNHFVDVQAEKVYEMLDIAFKKNDNPDLYIISPFTTVISELRSYLKKHFKDHLLSLIRYDKFDSWISKHIGTVHTFQGKEANEVIFLLGCDNSKEAEGAVRWVNSNIVNVAVTRAKYRLYIIGDESVWSKNRNLQTAKNIIDTYAIKEIHTILNDEEMDMASKTDALNKAAQQLPSITAFSIEERSEESGNKDYSVDTEGFVKGLETYKFMKEPLTAEQLKKFGFFSQNDIDKLSPRIRKNIELGMRLYYFLSPIYEIDKGFDASCCAILFCKAMELQMKECFIKGLKAAFPKIKIKGKGRKEVEISNAKDDEFTLGTFQYIIGKQANELGQYMKLRGKAKFNDKWWDEFGKKLSNCTRERNNCCHDGLFTWRNLSQLLADMFRTNHDNIKLEGLMFASEVGKMLNKEF